MRVAFAPLCALLLAHAGLGLALPPLGSVPPQMKLVPPDGPPQVLTTTAGRPALIFYESKASRGQNWPIKKRLKALAATSTSYRQRLLVLPIANLEGLDFWPVRDIAADAVRSEAKRIGEAIYCDWTGELRKALGVDKEQSSVILVAPSGKIVFAHEGPLPEAAQDTLLALLKDALSV